MGEFEVFIVVILSLPQISCRPQNTSFKLQVFFSSLNKNRIHSQGRDAIREPKDAELSYIDNAWDMDVIILPDDIFLLM